MYENQDTEEHVSQYPDPEHSGLSFPWLDQYQPVAEDDLCGRAHSRGFVPPEDEVTTPIRYGLRNRGNSSALMGEEGISHPSAVLEDCEDDPDFLETDDDTE